MMKFKQRVLFTSFLVFSGVLVVWLKLKAQNGSQNPVVLIEDSWLQNLLLGNRYDINDVEHVLRTTRGLYADKVSSKTSKPSAKTTNRITLKTRLFGTSLKNKQSNFVLIKPAWQIWKEMVKRQKVTQPGEEGEFKVHTIIKALQTAPVILMSVGYKGTQLKGTMFLKGNQRTVFKPKRYERDYIVEGGPYSGFDRHNGEIAAFHLDRILGFYRAPIVTGRILNWKTEVSPHIQKELQDTVFQKGNNTCLYGVCYYCNRKEPACADGDMMEGSVTIWLPEGWNLRTWRHPWQRTYRANKKARWEVDPRYCSNTVMKTRPYDRGPRLLSIIDTSIFDFLIGNADRHHYETFVAGGDDALVLHLDNGKSFGNPDWDESTILAPLYQCCRILRTTLRRIKHFSDQKNVKLGKVLEKELSSEPLAPVLTQKHLDAVDRRLLKIVNFVDQCIQKFGEDVVVVDSHG